VSWIEVRLAAEAGDRTRFELEHVAHVGDDRWLEFGPGAVGVGWDLGLLGLALHLVPGGREAIGDEAAWMASDEGRSFVRQSSEAWRAASVAAGTREEQAGEAAARTTAFYTGTEAPASSA